MAEVHDIARKQSFFVGQNVMLNSGSPPLCVHAIASGPKNPVPLVTVDWIVEGNWNRADFYAPQLCEAEGEKK